MQSWRRFFAWLVMVVLVSIPAWGMPVEAIPPPAPGEWSVDVTGTMRPETLAEVDRLGAEVDASNQGQLAVAVVDSTEGIQPRTFATQLFNLWGIGDMNRNDGVLLFFSLDDRKMEIVLGDGVDTPLDVERSDRVMERLVSLCAAGEVDAAVLEGARGLSTLLAQSPLNTGLNERDTSENLKETVKTVLLLIGGVAMFVYFLVKKIRDGLGGHFGGGSGGGSGGGFGGGSSSGSGSSGSC